MFQAKIKYDCQKYQVIQEGFDPLNVGKTEAIMNIGNGYLGQRAANEEESSQVKRNTFINGTFNQANPSEVSELPNIADTTKMEIYIDNEKILLQEHNFTHYQKILDLKTGEVRRQYIYSTKSNKKIKFTFKRFASYSQIHNIWQKIKIAEINNQAFDLKIINSIDGQVTNSGATHFDDGLKRIYQNQTMELLQTTSQSKILIAIRSSLKTWANQKAVYQNQISLDRRQIKITTNLVKIKNFELEKISTLVTSIDDSEELDLAKLNTLKRYQETRRKCQEIHRQGFAISYDQAQLSHLVQYQKQVWEMGKIKITADDYFDDLAIKFAKYHLSVFTPRHDGRLGIGAKGLSGEGYKGHSFWDTEMFILPIYNCLSPEIAKKLLTYRYNGLAGARKKAKDNNLKGAMYPWEAAWPLSGETTPVWGAIDIVTGKSTKIWSGFIEYHIVADIAYGLYQYYIMTNDQTFMNTKGYEILLETAIFWTSIVQKNQENKYEIKNVIGPNEYKEHVNNNAFTNYMAKWNIDLVLKLIAQNNQVIKKLILQLNVTEEQITKLKDVTENLILIKPNSQGIIGENDTYLSLPEVPNIEKYKNAKQVGALFNDYNLAQINQMQVSKQADLLILFLLQEKLFSPEIKAQNFAYYEKRTTHDSSLSLSTHAILAADLKLPLAYELFKKSSLIDLGKNMKSSDQGIHAASLAGMLLIVLNGFGGIRVHDQVLRIEPHIPASWKKLEFSIFFREQELALNITQEKWQITNHGKVKISFLHRQKMFELASQETKIFNY